jgi:hypothetical protein
MRETDRVVKMIVKTVIEMIEMIVTEIDIATNTVAKIETVVETETIAIIRKTAIETTATETTATETTATGVTVIGMTVLGMTATEMTVVGTIGITMTAAAMTVVEMTVVMTAHTMIGVMTVAILKTGLKTADGEKIAAAMTIEKKVGEKATTHGPIVDKTTMIIR